MNNSNEFGFRHVETALKRLKKGRKFGIILGNSAGLDTKTGREFWRKMSGEISIKGIIKTSGAEYAKNGTRVDVNLVIGRKNTVRSQSSLSFAPDKLINISAVTVESGFIVVSEGVVFRTYKSLIAKSKFGQRRIDRIMRLLGADGLEIFDEGHRAKHAFSGENGKATQTGQAVTEIQDPV